MKKNIIIDLIIVVVISLSACNAQETIQQISSYESGEQIMASIQTLSSFTSNGDYVTSDLKSETSSNDFRSEEAPSNIELSNNSSSNFSENPDTSESQIELSSMYSSIAEETGSISQDFSKNVSYVRSDGSINFNFGQIYLYSSDTELKNAHGDSIRKTGLSTDGNDYSTTITRKFNTAELQTTLKTNKDGTLTLAQAAEIQEGISSTSFTLTVSMDYDIIVPTWGGVRLTRENPDFYYGKNFRLSYPKDWQAQMLMIQGASGGLLIHSSDDASQFKALTITNDGVNFRVIIETIPQAPFDQYETFRTADWKMITYSGEWTEGAKIYREFTTGLFDLHGSYSQKASWASDVQFVVLDDLDDLALVDAFAREVIPTQTLILIPGWRKDPYDVNYPDYTPKPGIKEKIKYAQSLGFKVGVHCNMIGAEMTNPDYITYLTGSHSLDSFTKQPIIERYSAFGRDYAFAQINPASNEWRKLMVSKMKQLVTELDVDVIHLDQSLLCFNDGRGSIEGMTSMQGSIKLLKELSDALPEIAFSGEGFTEIDMQYISFIQMHVYGVNSSSKSFSDAAIEQICPVTTAIFGNYVSLYHYPALPVVDQTVYYDAWFRSGQRTGLLPTLMRESANNVNYPGKMMETVLNEALWHQQNSPKINIIDPWSDNTIFRYTLRNGVSAEIS